MAELPRDLERLLFVWLPNALGVAAKPAAQPGGIAQLVRVQFGEDAGELFGGEISSMVRLTSWEASSNQGNILSIAKRTDRGYITHNEVQV